MQAPLKILARAAVVVLAFALYFPALGSWFHGDDFNHLYEGKIHASPRHVAGFFLPQSGDGYYRPLDKILDVVQYAAFGLRAPLHHALSLALFALNILLFMLLIRDIGGSLAARLFAGALFLALPIHVEAVAWAVNRNMLFSAALYLVSMRFFLKALRGGGLRSAIIAAACFPLCAMFYDGAFSLPVAWILLFIFFPPEGKSLSRRSVALIAVPLAVAAAYAAFYFLFLRAGFGLHFGLNVPRNLNFYLRDMISPHNNWRFDRFFGIAPAAPVRGALELAVWMCAGGLIAIASRSRGAVFGFLWMFAGLAPFMTVYSERYSYFGSLGFCMVAGFAAERLAAGLRSRGIRAIAAALVLLALLSAAGICAVRTRKQIEYWRSAGETNRAQLSNLAAASGAPAPGLTLAVVAPPTDFVGVPGVMYFRSALDVIHNRHWNRIEVVYPPASTYEFESAVANLAKKEKQLRVVPFCYNLPPQGRYVDFGQLLSAEPRLTFARANRMFLYPASSANRLCLRCRMLLVCSGDFPQ